jgi:NAD(P)-dependent dehydrogenase (short-subunit alcohol dehydrogenase family)
VARLGRIDILINNVGRSEPGGPVELAEETWDEQLEVNLKTAYLMCKAVLPIMERQGSGSDRERVVRRGGCATSASRRSPTRPARRRSCSSPARRR